MSYFHPDALGGAIVQPKDIIRFLCMSDNKPSVLYIRKPCCIGPGLCMMLERNFREFVFPRTTVNKALSGGPG
jgi:hypothetical protein